MKYVPAFVMRVNSRELLYLGRHHFLRGVEPCRSVTMLSKLSRRQINCQIVALVQLHHIITGKSALTGGNIFFGERISNLITWG